MVQGMTENCLGTEAPQTRKGGDTWSLNSHTTSGQTFALHSAKTATQPRGRCAACGKPRTEKGRRPPAPSLRGISRISVEAGTKQKGESSLCISARSRPLCQTNTPPKEKRKRRRKAMPPCGQENTK